MRVSGVLIAIPAWNESGSVADVVRQVRTVLPNATVVVVDDGFLSLCCRRGD